MATAEQLREIERNFSAGSDQRYRHWFNGSFVLTEGLKQTAETAGAYWLVDIMATECYEQCMRRHQGPGDPGTNASLILEVKDSKAMLEMEFGYPYHEDKWTKSIDYTDFPEGRWVFSLEWDGIIAFPKCVLVGLLMAEH